MRSSILLVAAAVSSVIAQDACLTKCNSDYDKCRSPVAGQPSPNQSFCGSEYSKCLGYSPFPSTQNGTFVAPTACSAGGTGLPAATPAPASCLDKCNAANNACRSAPGANQASCSAQYAGCLGYNPYNQPPNGTFVTPTACAPPASTPTPAGTTPQQCADKCNADAAACRVAPQANQSFCSSQLAACIGYNPFNQPPNGTFVTPTACAPGATGLPATGGSSGGSAPSPAQQCAAKCNAAADACRVAPQANQSFCSSQLGACVGYNPFNAGPGGTFVTPTACAAGATGLPASGSGSNGGTPPAASPTPTYLQANGAGNSIQGSIVGVVGIIAAALMI